MKSKENTSVSPGLTPLSEHWKARSKSFLFPAARRFRVHWEHCKRRVRGISHPGVLKTPFGQPECERSLCVASGPSCIEPAPPPRLPPLERAARSRCKQTSKQQCSLICRRSLGAEEKEDKRFYLALMTLGTHFVRIQSKKCHSPNVRSTT